MQRPRKQKQEQKDKGPDLVTMGSEGIILFLGM